MLYVDNFHNFLLLVGDIFRLVSDVKGLGHAVYRRGCARAKLDRAE